MGVSHATKEQLQATSDLAQALEEKGVLDGDNIKMGLAQLSTFGLSNKAVQGLGQSLADLAVNQFGVNASGEQLSDTANMIAKALNGQFGVLEKSGIRFSDAQKNMIQFGTEMQKVDAINQGFAQNLKFTNEVALKTGEGAFAKLNVQFDNLKQSIGDQLAPMLVSLLQAISPIILKVTDWINKNPQLARDLILVAGAISGLVTFVGVLGLALPPLIAGFTALLGPVGLVAGAIIALGIAGYALYANWDVIKAKAIEIWGSISAFFQQVGSEISGAWSATWNFVSEVLTTTLALLVGAVITWLNFLFPNWQAVLSGMLQIAQQVFGTIGSFFQTILNGISSAISAVAKVITPIWQTLWGGVKSYFTDIWDGITGAIKSAVDFVAEQINRLSKLLAPVSKTASSIGSAIMSGFKSVVSTGKSALGVNDAIISPNGNVITTHPDDYLIATKNPYSLAGGGGITINISGNTLLSENVATEIGDMIIDAFKRNNRL
jgi:phage-related protein